MKTIQTAPAFRENFFECLRKTLTFTGRARRAEYWKFILATVILTVLVAVSAQLWGMNAKRMSDLVDLFFFVPSLAVTARRLHDVNRSGWWMLIALTGIGCIFLLYWMLKDSDDHYNNYGHSPKYGHQGGGDDDGFYTTTTTTTTVRRTTASDLENLV